MNTEYQITEPMLDALREELRGTMSEKRYRHTVEVERMVMRLGELYAPAYLPQLRAAALLHDITKEFSLQTQLQILKKFDIITYYSDEISPKTLHARTAACQIPEQYPAFASPVVIDAVRWHTTGRANMPLTERLLYLADYIDESRSFENCVILRRFFWGADPKEMTAEERERLLTDTLILSFDMTIKDLIAEGTPVASDTSEARNSLLLERAQMNA